MLMRAVVPLSHPEAGPRRLVAVTDAKPLPAWVHHQDRVYLWISAKLPINGVRIVIEKGFAA